ncbi:MAG: hypothetical protein JEZ14_22720 [Marinilabiliaceae bacterium]|nr:hypothetical protein [Marinilabiliaceae bacterium]
MKIITKSTKTEYAPVYMDGKNIKPYLDNDGKERVFKRMKSAEAFIKKQKESTRVIAKKETTFTIYQ